MSRLGRRRLEIHYEVRVVMHGLRPFREGPIAVPPNLSGIRRALQAAKDEGLDAKAMWDRMLAGHERVKQQEPAWARFASPTWEQVKPD